MSENTLFWIIGRQSTLASIAITTADSTHKICLFHETKNQNAPWNIIAK